MNRKRISVGPRAIIVLLVICVLATWAMAQVYYASPATRQRLTYAPPDPDRGWGATTDFSAFTWHPPQTLAGWTRGSANGIMFIAFHATNHELYRDEYHRYLVPGFAEDGGYEQSFGDITIAGHAGKEMAFAGEGGDGAYFAPGRTPTMARYVYVPLEKEPDTLIWPVLVAYCAAPIEVFDQVSADFEVFLSQIKIAPLGGNIMVRVVDSTTRAMPGVVVTLLKDGRIIKSGVTDSLGRYTFEDLDPGAYSLEALSRDSAYGKYVHPMAIDIKRGMELKLDLPLPKAGRKPIAVKPTKPAVVDTLGIRLGLGYRHLLDNTSGLFANARIGRLVPQVSFGFDLFNHAWASYSRIMASAGVGWFEPVAENLHIGASLLAGADYCVNDRPTWSVQLPLTAEYFLVPGKFSVFASAGPYVAFAANVTRWRLSYGFGFTWYLK